jgi:F-type H+-transporting ATPase subunit b
MDKWWFTFVAQIINFIVLVLLLRYFLYGRIVDAMKKREEGIASGIEDAEEQKAMAEKEAAEFLQKSEELESRRKELMAEAAEEAKNERMKLVESARSEADRMSARWRESVLQEEKAFFHDLRRQISRQVCEITGSALASLAGADLEARIIDTFILRLKNLPDDERRTIAESAEKSGKKVTVTSAFKIPDSKVSGLKKTVAGIAGKDVDVLFETSENLICGIELNAGGNQVAWSVESHMKSLERDLTEVINESVRRGELEQAESKA